MSSNEEHCSETERLLESPAPLQAIPNDRFNAVLIIFALLGVATLLPWNFFINAKLYFVYKLRNTSIPSDESWMNTSFYSDKQVFFLNQVETAGMVGGIVFQFLNIGFAQIFSWKSRVYFPLTTSAVMFVLTIVFAQLNTDSYQSSFAAVTLMTIAVLSASSSVLQGGAFGLACYFPKRYTQSLMAGGALAGLLSSIGNVVTLVFGSTPDKSGFAYFFIAEIAVIVTLASFVMFSYLDFSKFHLSWQGNQCTDLDVDVTPVSSSQVINTSSTSSVSENNGLIIIKQKPSLLVIIKQIWIEALSVFVVFLVTLICFPSLNSSIQSVSPNHTKWTSTFFVPVACFVLFNVGDLLGRVLVAAYQWPSESHRYLLLLCGFLRVGFIPLFLFCNVQPRNHLGVVFNTDVIPIVALFLFALSNGYFGTLGMMYAPRRVDSVNAELSGVVMSFVLSAGTTSGAVMSILLMKIV